MFYNIKINANDSEFSLESENKAIVQREMDLYFSKFFGASSEFNEKIAEIKITNPNVKSIYEVDVNKSIISTPLETCETSEPSQTNIQKDVIEEPILEDIKNTPNELLDIAPAKEPIEEVVKEAIEEPTIEPIEEPIEEPTIEPIEEPIEEVTQEPIEEPIQIKEPVIEPLDENTNKLSEIKEIKITSLSEAKFKEIKDDKPAISEGEIVSIRDIEKQPEIQQKEEKIEENTQEQSSKAEPEQKARSYEAMLLEAQKYMEQAQHAIEEEKPEPSLTNFDELIKQPEQNDLSEPSVYTQEQQEIQQNTNDDDISEALGIIFEQNTPKQDTIIEQKSPFDIIMDEPQKPSISEPEQKMSIEEPSVVEFEQKPVINNPINFSTFLGGFSVNELDKEFLICAFYIKNIAKMESFTMKSINSKLFQATGRIADMSIVDELIKKSYIKIVPTDALVTNYAITDSGEEFVAINLQNK